MSNNSINVIAIVEGKTEQIFIESLLAPYLALKRVYMTATQVTKSGQKGGDVRFERVKRDIELHLKQRKDIFVTTFVDYYGVRDWPGLDRIPAHAIPAQIAEIINGATTDAVLALFAKQGADQRFIPYMAIHEFEALLFSNSELLALELGISKKAVDAVITECGEPEAINNSHRTAPSKRLDKWSKKGKFSKVTTGIAVAHRIGIPQMRKQCPVFNTWLERLESFV
jgi:hypothetical protein